MALEVRELEGGERGDGDVVDAEAVTRGSAGELGVRACHRLNALDPQDPL